MVNSHRYHPIYQIFLFFIYIRGSVDRIEKPAIGKKTKAESFLTPTNHFRTLESIVGNYNITMRLPERGLVAFILLSLTIRKKRDCSVI